MDDQTIQDQPVKPADPANVSDDTQAAPVVTEATDGGYEPAPVAGGEEPSEAVTTPVTETATEAGDGQPLAQPTTEASEAEEAV